MTHVNSSLRKVHFLILNKTNIFSVYKTTTHPRDSLCINILKGSKIIKKINKIIKIFSCI